MLRTMALWALFLVLVVVTACTTQEPVNVQPADQGEEGTSESVPVELSAKRAKAKKSVLSTGAALSCVRVTVTNRTEDNLEVNPLYFSITGANGTKHESSTALGEYENEIATTTLAPDENAKGVVCARGDFRPKIVAMADPFMSEMARAEVP